MSREREKKKRKKEKKKKPFFFRRGKAKKKKKKKEFRSESNESFSLAFSPDLNSQTLKNSQNVFNFLNLFDMG
jgi:hypothetical protein